MTESSPAHSGRIQTLPKPGAQLGPFSVVGTLGQGAMGLVLHVRDATGRDLALKLLTKGLEAEGRQLERFRREGELLATLRHVGIVGVHSAGVVLNWPYIDCEYVVGGRTLEHVFAEGDREQSVRLVGEAALAMGFAHAQGILHRDLKPANVLVDAEGHARVADFGLAQAAGLERLTLSGAVVGTPSSMAPEQVVGDRAAYGPHTDVWALGTLLYQALTGELPFSGESMTELAARITSLEPTPPSTLDRTVSAGLEAVCLKALRKSPAERYADGSAFANDLQRALVGSVTEATPVARRRGPLLVAAVLALAACLGGLGALAARPEGSPEPDTRPTRISAEEARRNRQEARLLARLDAALAHDQASPAEVGDKLRRLRAADFAESAACLERLREAQAVWAQRLQATLARPAPELDQITLEVDVLARLAELLPRDDPPFPRGNDAFNRIVELLKEASGIHLELLESMARTHARISDERLAYDLFTLLWLGMTNPDWVTQEQGERLVVVYAKLDVGFKSGLQVSPNEADPSATPQGDDPWSRYVRLRTQAFLGPQGRECRAELRRLHTEPPEGLDLGPIQRAELAFVSAMDLSPAKQLPFLEAALRHDPGFAAAWNLRARALSQLGRHAEASQALGRAEASFKAHGYDIFATTKQHGAKLEWTRIELLCEQDQREAAFAALAAVRDRYSLMGLIPKPLQKRFPWLR